METVVDIYQVLKDLALKFDESNDPDVFIWILVKVTNLLKYSIRRARKIHPHLCEIEFDDLYQTAVIGLYRAVAKITPDQPGSKLVYNILRYVENELLKDYKYKLIFNNNVANFDEFSSQKFNLMDTTEVYVDLEAEFIQERFQKLIKDGVISAYEFDILNRHFVQGLSCRDIARQDGKGNSTISRKVRDSLNRIRWEWRRRHWEEG